MTMDELALHDGSRPGYAAYVSSCGFIFEHSPIFNVYRGRDITQRNVLHMRGVNLDTNDDGGKSPFPRLSKLAPHELEYALQNRDRLIQKSPPPVAVLQEFWQEQESSLEGVYEGNTLSKL